MSILNVNQIQPVGSGQTITISASDITASSATITASSVTATTVTSSSTSTFSSGLNVTGGSVGIGTDNPTFLLQVQDDSESLARFRRENTGSNQGGIIVGNQSRAIKITGGNDGLIITDNTLSQERLRIHSSGKVGINTDDFSRDYRLSIADSSSAGTLAGILINDTDGKEFSIRSSSNGLRFRDVTSGNDRLVIDTNGNLVFPTSGQGIDFSATADGSGTTTSELLDDYEEGTWTPTLSPESGAFTSVTYTVQSGSYTKIGNTVFLRAHFYTNGITVGTASGNLNVSGLPFTGANLSGMALHDVRLWSTNPSSCGLSGSTIYLFKQTSHNANEARMQVSDLVTSGVGNLGVFSGVYDIT